MGNLALEAPRLKKLRNHTFRLGVADGFGGVARLGSLAQKCMKQAFQGMISAIWLPGPRNAQNEPSRAWPAPKRHPGAPRRHPQERPRKHPQARRGPQEAPGGLGGNMCENICVFSAKVSRPGISSSVWRGDPHDLRSLSTKVDHCGGAETSTDKTPIPKNTRQNPYRRSCLGNIRAGWSNFWKCLLL